MVKVLSVDDPCVTVDVPGRNSNNQIGHPMTVKMDCSGISSTTFQHIELIRDLQFLRRFHEEIPKPQVWNHGSVPDHDGRPLSEFSLSIVFLNIRNIPCNADFHREPHIR